MANYIGKFSNNSSHPNLTLLIAVKNISSYSQTFVERHITDLPFNIRILHGSDLSTTREGKNILSLSLLGHLRHYLSRTFGKYSFENFRERRIANYLTSESVDVVLAEFADTAGIKMMKACERANTPLIVHFHGCDAYLNNLLDEAASAYAELFRTATAIIGVSKDMCNKLETLGAPTDKIHYVPYFVDTKMFQKIDAGANPPCFLAVGRFVEKKASHLTVLAFARVLEVVPEATLGFIGDGPLFGPTKLLVRAIGIEQSVVFHGKCDHQDVAKAMQNSRCFVQHSVIAEDGDSEGTPVAILEAQASGLPVVATRHTGIKDVVVEGETGFLVDEGDIESMADHMINIAKDSGLASFLGANATDRINSNFNASKTIDKLADVINNSHGDR